MDIVTPNSEDLKSLVKLRSVLFPASFSTKLGPRYMLKVFEMYLKLDKFSIFVAKVNNECIGYIVGQLSDSHITGLGSASTTIKYTFWDAILSLLRKPWLIYGFVFKYKILRKLKYIVLSLIGQKPKYNSSTEIKLNNGLFCLVDFGVHYEHRSTFASIQLMKHIEEVARKLNAINMMSSIKKDNPIKVLYQYLNWNVYSEDEKSFTYEKKIK